MTSPSPSTFAGPWAAGSSCSSIQSPSCRIPRRAPQWNRGAYLVEGPGHCAECHSPRNVLGAIKPAERFAGGPDPEGKGWVPNITPHADGIGAWSEAEIAEFLKSGLTPEFDSQRGARWPR